MTFHPDVEVEENIRAMVRECGRVVVVDNGSGSDVLSVLAAVDGVVLLSQERNIGLAAALNLGVAKMAELGCTWVVTFDQDSRPAAGMVDALWTTHVAMPLAAMVGPQIIDKGATPHAYHWLARHPVMPFWFTRVECAGSDLAEITALITSGSMIEVETWRRLGGFDDELFIDCIDTDYCLRVVRSGRRIAVAAQAVLLHRLGARQSRRFLGWVVRPTHHAAFRHYYMARNRVIALRRHALAVPHWASFDLCFALYNGLRVLAFEHRKGAKLLAMILGTWDGILGRKGPCPESRSRLFAS